MPESLDDQGMTERAPAVLVWSSLFPSAAQPQAGIFIRERMFRVGKHLPLTVISPQPWFPLQGLIRRFRPHFRPHAPRREQQMGIDILRPRFLSVPGLFKQFDGFMMALGALPTVRRMVKAGRVDVIDAHFAYPDGYAAAKVGQWLGQPVTITLRGTEVRHATDPALRPRVLKALRQASKVFSVSSSLRKLAVELGIDGAKVRVVGNGVDSGRFSVMDKVAARASLELPSDAKVLITVGGLVERKGFHRVIACLPELLKIYPELHYVAVGSTGPEGDYTREIKALVGQLGVQSRVHVLGALPPEEVCIALSAADVSVLATRNEGWANVLLEAMACGLPVVATDVGGNAEVINHPSLGRVVPFGDHAALRDALAEALALSWDRHAIRRYAEENDWQLRVDVLLEEFRRLATTDVGREQRAAHVG